MKLYSFRTAILAATGIMAMSLTGCLKDKDFVDGTIQSVTSGSGNSPKVIEIGLTGTNNVNFQGLSLNATNTDTTFGFIPVNLASSQPAQEDINVTLTKTDALVTAYNTAHGTAYTVPASTKFTILNAGNVVTIAKGTYTGFLRVKFKPSDFLGSDYALGYTISSVDKPGYTISGNLRNGVVAIAIKNKYDGRYRVTGSMVDLTNATLTGTYPLTWELITTSGSAVAVYDESTGTQTHLISSAGSPSQYGSFGLNLTFDPVTNKITNVVNSFGQPSSNGRSAALDPTGVNAWDPLTGNIKIKYFLLQPGTTVRTTFDETWTYLGPR